MVVSGHRESEQPSHTSLQLALSIKREEWVEIHIRICGDWPEAKLLKNCGFWYDL
jgi:hypothetical protein